jgi:hypothetical protein
MYHLLRNIRVLRLFGIGNVKGNKGCPTCITRNQGRLSQVILVAMRLDRHGQIIVDRGFCSVLLDRCATTLYVGLQKRILSSVGFRSFSNRYSTIVEVIK